ncbi:hypothetical protein AR457_01370 [Streptomyces agglomeratus]|nr:hypothetical protein AR457_01370 [Streptomyces agglomeratus]
MFWTQGPSAGSGGRVGSPFSSRGTELSRASCSARVGSVTPPGGVLSRVAEAGVEVASDWWGVLGVLLFGDGAVSGV